MWNALPPLGRPVHAYLKSDYLLSPKEDNPDRRGFDPHAAAPGLYQHIGSRSHKLGRCTDEREGARACRAAGREERAREFAADPGGQLALGSRDLPAGGGQHPGPQVEVRTEQVEDHLGVPVEDLLE